MIEKPVCIIGCGSFALLLAEMKVPIVEQRFDPLERALSIRGRWS